MNPAAPGAPRYNVIVELLERRKDPQDLHLEDRPGQAVLRLLQMRRTNRSTPFIHIGRLLRGPTLYTVLDIARGMSLESANGLGMIRDIGVCREA